MAAFLLCSPSTLPRYEDKIYRFKTILAPVHSQLACRSQRDYPHRMMRMAYDGNSHAETRDPILLRCARGEEVERPPVWLMRQAGRYMAAFRRFSEKYPFRQRSETPEIAIELSLQPWRAFQMDGVIMFSDILTPLPAMGVEFDVVTGIGPIIENPVISLPEAEQMARTGFNPARNLLFVREILSSLRDEIGGETALLGFIGAPFTLAAYVIDGRAKRTLAVTKRMMFGNEDERKTLRTVLTTLASNCAEYACFQISSGAQIIQLFDSWAHHLTPDQYEAHALPYAYQTAAQIKAVYPDVPLIFFANGCAAKLESLKSTLSGVVDVISLDWSVSMADARTSLGPDTVVQGNIDPALLLVGDDRTVRKAVRDCIEQAGRSRHILNLGHGVIQGTPEENVASFCDAAKKSMYSKLAVG